MSGHLDTGTGTRPDSAPLFPDPGAESNTNRRMTGGRHGNLGVGSRGPSFHLASTGGRIALFSAVQVLEASIYSMPALDARSWSRTRTTLGDAEPRDRSLSLLQTGHCGSRIVSCSNRDLYLSSCEFQCRRLAIYTLLTREDSPGFHAQDALNPRRDSPCRQFPHTYPWRNPGNQETWAQEARR